MPAQHWLGRLLSANLDFSTQTYVQTGTNSEDSRQKLDWRADLPIEVLSLHFRFKNTPHKSFLQPKSSLYDNIIDLPSF